MKISGDNYRILKERIQKTLEKYGDPAAEYRRRELSFTRYIWDVYSMSNFRVSDEKSWIPGDIIVPGYNDSHIETALKKIFRELDVDQW